jgi:hypothetical protein
MEIRRSSLSFLPHSPPLSFSSLLCLLISPLLPLSSPLLPTYLDQSLLYFLEAQSKRNPPLNLLEEGWEENRAVELRYVRMKGLRRREEGEGWRREKKGVGGIRREGRGGRTYYLLST